MTVTVTKSNGDIAAVVENYKKEIIAGLSIMGYGYVNFSQDVANDFVRISENFKSPTSPYNPVIGQLWYDTRSDISSWPIRYPVLRVCSRVATVLDDVTFVTTDSSGNNTDGSNWIPLFAIDTTNNRAGLLYNNVPTFPDVAATPGSLVVRGTNGLIDPASFAAVGSVGHSTNSDYSTATGKLAAAKAFGSRRGPNSFTSPPSAVGYPFDGTADCFFTTDYIAEGSDSTYGKFFTTDRARQAISVAGDLSYNASTGVISFTAQSAGGVTSFNGRGGGVSLNSGDVTGALGFTPVNKAGDVMTGDLTVSGIVHATTPSNDSTTGGFRLRVNSDGNAIIQNLTADGQGQVSYIWMNSNTITFNTKRLLTTDDLNNLSTLPNTSLVKLGSNQSVVASYSQPSGDVTSFAGLSQRMQTSGTFTLFTVTMNKNYANSFMEIETQLDLVNNNDLMYSLEIYRNPGTDGSFSENNILRRYFHSIYSDLTNTTASVDYNNYIDNSDGNFNASTGQYTWIIVMRNLQSLYRDTNPIAVGSDTYVRITETRTS